MIFVTSSQSFSRIAWHILSYLSSYTGSWLAPRAKKKNVITSLVFCSFTRSPFVFATVHHSLWQLSLEPFLQPFLDLLPCYTDCNSSQTMDVRLNKCCLHGLLDWWVVVLHSRIPFHTERRLLQYFWSIVVSGKNSKIWLASKKNQSF